MNTVPDNPASRYHAILKEVRSGDVKRPLLEAWARALEVGSKDRVELARRMAATATLLSDINDHLAALPADQFDPKNFRLHFVAWSKPLLVCRRSSNSPS